MLQQNIIKQRLSIILKLMLCLILLNACQQIETENEVLDKNRGFNMGFSTWTFGPNDADIKSTMDFISAHADIYAEQVDDKIPWDGML